MPGRNDRARVTQPEREREHAPLLIAPDSFKGTFTAEAAALALARGATDAGLATEICPVADGGEGTADAIRRARGGTVRRALVHDPLGRPVQAAFVLLPDGETAVLDSAAASGLALIEEAERDPLGASTAGTGELIVAAVEAGASRVLLAAGGSATTDGGRGAISAIRAAGGLRGATLTVLCDVRTPFELAASVFAPQKGASAEQVAFLSERLQELAGELPRDPRGVPMSGCAGGLSGGLWAAFDAKLLPGAEFVFQAVGLNATIRRARAVVSGEGRLDEQSLDGKLIGALAAFCRTRDLELHVVTGRDALDPQRARLAGIASVREARTGSELVQAGRQIALSLFARAERQGIANR